MKPVLQILGKAYKSWQILGPRRTSAVIFFDILYSGYPVLFSKPFFNYYHSLKIPCLFNGKGKYRYPKSEDFPLPSELHPLSKFWPSLYGLLFTEIYCESRTTNSSLPFKRSWPYHYIQDCPYRLWPGGDISPPHTGL